MLAIEKCTSSLAQRSIYMPLVLGKFVVRVVAPEVDSV